MKREKVEATWTQPACACKNPGGSVGTAARVLDNGALWRVCCACSGIMDLLATPEEVRAGEREKALAEKRGEAVRRGHEPWKSVGHALGYYLRGRARAGSTRSSMRTLLEIAETTGVMVQGGRRAGGWIDGGGGRGDVIAGDLALIEKCLPQAVRDDGGRSEKGEVALALLLATAGRSREDGLTLRQAAEIVRKEKGDEWTFATCKRLLERAVSETRGSMRARGLIPQGWGG